MILSIPKEIIPGENRVAAIPATIKEFIKNGLTVQVQSGAGEGSFLSDEDYTSVGAEIIADAAALFAQSDLILKVNPPVFNENTGKHEADMLKPGSAFVSFFQTTIDKKVVQKFRCTSGWRSGRLVATPQSCTKPIDMKKRFTLRKTKARLGKRIARKTARAKRFNPITKRVTQLNKSTRPKTPGRSKGGVKWWHRR